MARKLRIEFEGAVYYVISRRNYRAAVFGHEATQTSFLTCLAEASERSGWVAASTNKTQVRAFSFPLPPTLEEQSEIVAVMRAAKAKLAALLQKEKALAQLKIPDARLADGPGARENSPLSG